jgi:hypothetical protein
MLLWFVSNWSQTHQLKTLLCLLFYKCLGSWYNVHLMLLRFLSNWSQTHQLKRDSSFVGDGHMNTWWVFHLLLMDSSMVFSKEVNSANTCVTRCTHEREGFLDSIAINHKTIVVLCFQISKTIVFFEGQGGGCWHFWSSIWSSLF